MLQLVWGGHGSRSGSASGWILIAVQGQRQDYGLPQKLACLLKTQTLKGHQWKFGLENILPSGPGRSQGSSSSSAEVLSEEKHSGKWKSLDWAPGKLVVQNMQTPWYRCPKARASDAYEAPTEAKEKQITPIPLHISLEDCSHNQGWRGFSQKTIPTEDELTVESYKTQEVKKIQHEWE